MKNKYLATCASIESNSINIEFANLIMGIGLLILLELFISCTKRTSVKLYSVQDFIMYKFCKILN